MTYYLKKYPIFKANAIHIFLWLLFFNNSCDFVFFSFFFFSLILYFWKSNLYSRFLIFAFWYMLSILSEKAMAPHSSTLAWKIPWTEELSRLQFMRSLRVGYDWANSLSLFTFMHWRRKWQPTPVFLPGESQGQGSLVGCRLWGCTESDTTEVT